jgi:transposase
MEGRQRRSFTDDYKWQAVALVASSGRSIGSVAKELGLRDSVLRRWVEARGAGREPTVRRLSPHNYLRRLGASQRPNRVAKA